MDSIIIQVSESQLNNSAIILGTKSFLELAFTGPVQSSCFLILLLHLKSKLEVSFPLLSHYSMSNRHNQNLKLFLMQWRQLFNNIYEKIWSCFCLSCNLLLTCSFLNKKGEKKRASVGFLLKDTQAEWQISFYYYFFYLQSQESEPWNQRIHVSLQFKQNKAGNGQKQVTLCLKDQNNEEFLGVLRL